MDDDVNAYQHAGHFLCIDWQDQAASGPRLQHGSHQGRLRGRNQDENWSNRAAYLIAQGPTQTQGLRHIIAGTYDQKVRRPEVAILS
jgi:hypothetical protein